MESHEVFGIAPEVREYSYVDRGSLDETLDRFLRRTLHVAVRGPSKCGKSWLRQKALRDSIVVQCRHNKPHTDIYVDALSQLGIRTELKQSQSGSFRATLSASGEGGAALLAKVSVSGTVASERGKSTDSKPVGHDVDDLRFVADLIRSSGRRLVIEDFHYMTVEQRQTFAFDLKALWDFRVFVVIVGIWSESNLLLQLNSDLTGRVHEISIEWTHDDLKRILTKGGAELNVDFSEAIRNTLARLAYSNAGILQQLALLTLDEANVKKKGFFRQSVEDPKAVEAAAMLYADQLNPLYQQFAKNVSTGIRTRKGSTGIYAHTLAVVLAATDEELMRGLHARTIFQRAVERQSRIQYGNLKSILEKLEGLQIDEQGRGMLITYNSFAEEVSIVDRQLLLYRNFATVKWPWEALIAEADSGGGQLDGE